MDRFINEDAHRKIRLNYFCSAIFSLVFSKEGTQTHNGQSTSGIRPVSVVGRIDR